LAAHCPDRKIITLCSRNVIGRSARPSYARSSRSSTRPLSDAAMRSLSLPHPVAHAGPTRRSLSSRVDQRLSRTPVYRPSTYVVDAQKSKKRLLGAGDQEPLISPSTVTQVRKHIECLVKALSARTPTDETVELKRSPVNSSGAAAKGVLSIPPLIYREYAAEYKELARTTTNDSERALYLKMANTWRYAAVRFEAGLETNGSISDRG
jgi:hypothetical protein